MNHINGIPPRLDRESIKRAAKRLAKLDPALRPVLSSLGPPPLWGRPASFATLIRIILEQSVSLAAARAVHDRLHQACGTNITASQVLALGPQQLRSIGFSQQKARYALLLADDVRQRRFSISGLAKLADEEVREQITSRMGLGRWTADIYLVMALRRPDVFPAGDLALVKGMRELDGGDYAAAQSVELRAERWRPYRAVAARMVWQSYLHRRGRVLK